MTKRLENVTRPAGNLDARDAITKKIDIGAHRKRGIGVDPVGREQVSVTSGMDVELKEHRRWSRTLKCDVKARFDQHEPRSPPRHGPRPGAAQLGAVEGTFRTGLELASKAAELKRPSPGSARICKPLGANSSNTKETDLLRILGLLVTARHIRGP